MRPRDWRADARQARGLNEVYIPMEASLDGFDGAAKGLSLVGNVPALLTMPPNTDVGCYCSDVSATTQLAGGVHAMRHTRDGSSHGYASGGDALVASVADTRTVIDVCPDDPSGFDVTCNATPLDLLRDVPAPVDLAVLTPYRSLRLDVDV